MILYDNPLSGNCYKIRLLLAHLGTPYERVRIEVEGDRSNRPAEFLARSPASKIPLLVLDDERALAESGAILVHLARDTDFLPDDPFEQSQVLSWLFFEQNQHEPNIATRRYWTSIAESSKPAEGALGFWLVAGRRALEVMEKHLADREWFVGERMTIADLALYGYTHEAEKGGFELEPCPNVRAWLARVAAQPGHVPIDA